MSFICLLSMCCYNMQCNNQLNDGFFLKEENQEERRKERKFIYQFLSIFLHVALFRSYTPIKINFREVPDLR